MFKDISTIILLFASVSGAPTASQHFISPEPSATSSSSSQYVYLPSETKLHLQQPILKIEVPKEQLIYIYPNGHVSQYESIFLRQDNPLDWWATNAQNLWQSVSGNFQFPGSENPSSSAEGPPSGNVMMSDAAMKFKTDQQEKITFDSRINVDNNINDEKFETINKINFEKINMDKINLGGLLPASTVPLGMTNNKYYILREQPQFYGNYDALHMAAISPLIKLQSYKTARSIDDASVTDAVITGTVVQVGSRANTADYIPVPIIVDSILPKQLIENSRLPQVPLVSGEVVQLRSNVNTPVQSLEPVFVPQLEMIDSVVGQVRGVGSGSIVGRSTQKIDKSEHDASIAQAKPNGLAIAGKGGIASSAPTATAITGKGGLSLAAPKATAIAGNLSGSDDDDDNDEVDSDKSITD